MEFFIYLIIFLIFSPVISLILGGGGLIIMFLFRILLSKGFSIIVLLILIGFIPGIFIWDQMNPKKVAVLANNAIRIYPTRECRSKTLFEYKNSDFEYLDGYGSDSSEIIIRDHFENLYYNYRRRRRYKGIKCRRVPERSGASGIPPIRKCL